MMDLTAELEMSPDFISEIQSSEKKNGAKGKKVQWAIKKDTILCTL